MEKTLFIWAGLYGWVVWLGCMVGVKNIITLFGMSDVWCGEGVVRVAGIFAVPIGAVMGYI